MKFILHGGFHKTATTHIQRELEAHTAALARYGVVVASHKRLRRHYTKVLAQDGVVQPREFGTNANEDHTAIAEMFDQLRFGDTQRLVFSEENFIGHVGQVALTGDLYQSPRKYLSKLREHLPVAPTDILLAVRNYSNFFASCYVEYLGSAPHDKFVLPQIMTTKVMGNMPSWERVIDLFADVFPEAQIGVWRYEDFSANYDKIMGELTGDDAYQMFKKSQGAEARTTKARKSVGAVTIQKFLDRVAIDGIETALMRWRDIKADCHGLEDGKPFDPWTTQQRAHLEKMYDQDWQTIMNKPNVRVIA